MTWFLKKKETRDNLEYEFLPPAMEIEETPPSPAKGILIWMIFALIIVAFLWSYFGVVDEVAVARGTLVPDGDVKVVQPLEIGVIRAIHVKEGQEIKKGQLLVEMDPTINEADVDSTVQNLTIQMTQKERLQEELTGKRHVLPSDIANKISAETEELQTQLKSVSQSEFSAKEQAQQAKVGEKRDALMSAEAELEKLRETSAIIKEEAAAYDAAYHDDYISKMEHLDKQKELFSYEQEYAAQEKTVQEDREGLVEAQQTLAALRNEHKRDILKDILDRKKDIDSLKGELDKAQKRYELDKLPAPVSGTVTGLQFHTIGGVVTPAQTIMTIVPDGTPLVVDAVVENKDIGFIKDGQEAVIKLDTFPFEKYGTIKGVVKRISANSFENKDNENKDKSTDKGQDKEPVYKIKVEMEKTSMMVDGKLVRLTPGMSASVEVKTGKRKIIQFFLSPIMKYAKESLTIR